MRKVRFRISGECRGLSAGALLTRVRHEFPEGKLLDLLLFGSYRKDVSATRSKKLWVASQANEAVAEMERTNP